MFLLTTITNNARYLVEVAGREGLVPIIDSISYICLLYEAGCQSSCVAQTGLSFTALFLPQPPKFQAPRDACLPLFYLFIYFFKAKLVFLSLGRVM